jgi:hypothetical protein
VDAELYDLIVQNSATLGGDLDAGGNSLTNVGAVEADQVTSRSLPTWRVYRDGSDVVAVDETDAEIDRGTDATTVWQAVFDQANNQFNDNEKFEPVAEINAGFELFSLSSGLIMRPGAVLQNARFDASSLASPSTALVIGPDDGVLKGGLGTHNVVIRGAADTAFHIKDAVHARFSNLMAQSPTGDGFELSSVIGCTLDKIHSRAGGKVGIRTNKAGDSGALFNSNTLIEPRASGSTNEGFYIQNAQHCEFIGPIAESGGDIGILEADLVSDEVNHNQYRNPWIESNGSYGILAQGTGSTFETPRLDGSEGGGGGNQGLRINKSDRVIVRGPINGNDLVNVAGEAVDTRLYDLSNGDISDDRGARTQYDGIGKNAGDPNSTGQWNGNGHEGAVVVDTSNSVTYHYRGGSWV